MTQDAGPGDGQNWGIVSGGEACPRGPAGRRDTGRRQHRAGTGKQRARPEGQAALGERRSSGAQNAGHGRTPGGAPVTGKCGRCQGGAARPTRAADRQTPMGAPRAERAHRPTEGADSPGHTNVSSWGKLRISLGLVDLSRTPSGTFFREVHPGSEMASQNDQNKAK